MISTEVIKSNIDEGRSILKKIDASLLTEQT
jgi:hypothetical protein